MRSRNAVQRSTWRSWKPVGTAEVLQALGLPVDVAEQRDPLDQLVREALAGVEVGVERRRPPVGVHRRPAVDPTHQVEGAAEHRRVLAHADGGGVRHLGAVERLDDAPLAQDALVAVDGRRRRRDADHAVEVAPPQLVDLVLRTAGDERVLERLTLAVEALVVHPCSRAGRNRSQVPHLVVQVLGVLRLGRSQLLGQMLGRPEIIGRLVLAEQLPGHGDLVHLGRAVGQTHRRRAHDQAHEGHLVADARARRAPASPATRCRAARSA